MRQEDLSQHCHGGCISFPSHSCSSSELSVVDPVPSIFHRVRLKVIPTKPATQLKTVTVKGKGVSHLLTQLQACKVTWCSEALLCGLRVAGIIVGVVMGHNRCICVIK